jgi:hypothetical protein
VYIRPIKKLATDKKSPHLEESNAEKIILIRPIYREKSAPDWKKVVNFERLQESVALSE